jgi:GNAT superfamily N-acetyltransferase
MSRRSFRREVLPTCAPGLFSLVPLADSRYEIRDTCPDLIRFGLFVRWNSRKKAASKEENTMTAKEIIYGGYWPGVIGKITELHGVYYHANWGFDISFEAQVGRELSEFLRDFRDGRDFFRTTRAGDRFAGSIAIDGKNAGSKGARLRWFIVAPEFQRLGIGRRLIREATHFCREAGYGRIFLWTFKGLNSARVLYESEGFRLAAENDIRQWGNSITEQMFVLDQQV